MDTKINLQGFLTNSKRGGDKINYLGYGYNYKEQKSGVIIWRCCKRGCVGLLKTTKDYDLIYVGFHSHLQNENVIKSMQLIEKMKERAIKTTETPRNIISKVLNNEKVFGGVTHTTKYLTEQILKKRRNASFGSENASNNLDKIRYTNNGVNFILRECGLDEDNGFIVFGTESNLIHLSENKIWVIDCTFKVAPAGFQQLLTIQARIRDEYVALLYVILKNKSLVSYSGIFKWISLTKNVKSPENIIIDFEQALFLGIKLAFPTSAINGCLFHLGQIIWRKLQSFCFTEKYKCCYSFCYCIKLINALAFVPEYDILKFAKLLYAYFKRENMDEDLITVLNWFIEKFCVSSNNENHNPKFWSVYKRTKDGLPRTTNSLEGYHRHLNCVLNTNNPSVLQFGEGILLEYQFNCKKMNDSIKNYWSNYNIKKIEMTELKLVIENFEAYYDVEYLKAIVCAFNFIY